MIDLCVFKGASTDSYPENSHLPDDKHCGYRAYLTQV